MKYPIIKELLSRLGPFVSPRVIHHVNGLLNYLHVGGWMYRRGCPVPQRVGDRDTLYQLLALELCEPVTYLEFGVFRGDSMRRWVSLLENPDSRFHGFDSFEGLPEEWGLLCGKETFDVEGRLPVIDDSRVRFHKGWFSQTVPPFLRTFKRMNRLIVHLDADVYSSTIYVLRQVSPWLESGDILVFDEFFDREHETKAFDEFVNENAVQFECIAATRALTQVAFRIISLKHVDCVSVRAEKEECSS